MAGNTLVVEHRVSELERDVSKLAAELDKLEERVRLLEVAWAKMVAFSSGGALAGGALFQLFQWLATK